MLLYNSYMGSYLQISSKLMDRLLMVNYCSFSHTFANIGSPIAKNQIGSKKKCLYTHRPLYCVVTGLNCAYVYHYEQNTDQISFSPPQQYKIEAQTCCPADLFSLNYGTMANVCFQKYLFIKTLTLTWRL